VGAATATLPVGALAQSRIALACGSGHRLTAEGLELAPDGFALIAPL
jgi:hypothetical protein